MKSRKLLTGAIVTGLLTGAAAFAGHDEHKDGDHHDKKEMHHDKDHDGDNDHHDKKMKKKKGSCHSKDGCGH